LNAPIDPIQTQACPNSGRVPIAQFMEIPFALIQFTASLVAILLLAGLAYWLGLGRPARFESDDDVRRAASEAIYGFEAEEVARGACGTAALARDGDGRILVLRLHGSKFAGRLLSDRARVWLGGGDETRKLHIDCGEPGFADITLDIEAPEFWAQAIEGLKEKPHA